MTKRNKDKAKDKRAKRSGAHGGTPRFENFEQVRTAFTAELRAQQSDLQEKLCSARSLLPEYFGGDKQGFNTLEERVANGMHIQTMTAFHAVLQHPRFRLQCFRTPNGLLSASTVVNSSLGQQEVGELAAIWDTIIGTEGCGADDYKLHGVWTHSSLVKGYVFPKPQCVDVD